MFIIKVWWIITHKLPRVTSLTLSVNARYLQVKIVWRGVSAGKHSKAVLQFSQKTTNVYLEVCGCCKPAWWWLWGVRHNVEILLDQTAINAQSLPGSTTVNNRWVSVSWMSNQSWGCVHFNALSREVYGFLFWHVNVANNRESQASIIKISWYFIRGHKSVVAWNQWTDFLDWTFLMHWFLTPDCLIQPRKVNMSLWVLFTPVVHITMLHLPITSFIDYYFLD